MARTGDLTTLRFFFAKNGDDECNGDVTTVELIQQRNEKDRRRNERDDDQTPRPSLVLVAKVSDGDQHRCNHGDEARKECDQYANGHFGGTLDTVLWPKTLSE
jgi:hypothetical protein